MPTMINEVLNFKSRASSLEHILCGITLTCKDCKHNQFSAEYYGYPKMRKKTSELKKTSKLYILSLLKILTLVMFIFQVLWTSSDDVDDLRFTCNKRGSQVDVSQVIHCLENYNLPSSVPPPSPIYFCP